LEKNHPIRSKIPGGIMPDLAIQTQALTKNYGSVRVLRGCPSAWLREAPPKGASGSGGTGD